MNCKEDVSKKLDIIYSHAKEILNLVTMCKNRFPDIPEAQEQILCKINKETIIIHNACQRAHEMMPGIDGYETVFTSPTMKIEKKDTYYRFVLDDLLPHKMTYDVSEKRERYLSDRDMIYSGYRTAVEEYCKENDIVKYSEKALCLFVHHYKAGSKMMDHDNLQSKIFIDAAINNIFVAGDNPKLLDIHHTSVEESIGHSYTEVLLGKKQDIILLL